MSMGAKFSDDDVLIVVDVQNDFCPGGALAVPRGDEIIAAVNSLAARFRNVVLTQDWHPPGHASFASSHPGKKPYETIAASYGPQVLWPDHCVQGTPGAEFHPALRIAHAALVLRKGFRPGDRFRTRRSTRMTARPRPALAATCASAGSRGCFLPDSPSIFASAIPPKTRRPSGFDAFVIEDACRGIDIGWLRGRGPQQPRRALGIPCVNTREFV